MMIAGNFLCRVDSRVQSPIVDIAGGSCQASQRSVEITHDFELMTHSLFAGFAGEATPQGRHCALSSHTVGGYVCSVNLMGDFFSKGMRATTQGYSGRSR